MDSTTPSQMKDDGDWYMVFGTVRRDIVPEVGVFRICVTRKTDGTRLGANGPYFSPSSNQEPETTSVEVYLRVGSLSSITKEELEADISWKVVSEKLGELQGVWLDTVILAPPQLIWRPRIGIDVTNG